MGSGSFLNIFLTSLVVQTLYAQDLRESFYNEVKKLILDLPRIQYIREPPPTPIEVVEWGDGLEDYLGQITGVSINQLGQPVLFHRGPRTWDSQSFNRTFHFQLQDPINEDTIVVLDPISGRIVSSWGAGIFYLPHGITVDKSDNVWLTDVAMHQVLKWPANSSYPTLRLGEFFNPGKGKNQFCQPTSVAVASTKDFFIADGYCNSRILKFNHKGTLIRIFPQNDEFLSLLIPHSLSLIERRDTLCVADRENMRVACFKAELNHREKQNSTKLNPFTIHQPDFGRIYAIDTLGNYVYAINGPTSPLPVQGFIIDPFSEVVVDHWAPLTQTFTSPHDMAISPSDGSLYVAELFPNKIWKFKLQPVDISNLK